MYTVWSIFHGQKRIFSVVLHVNCKRWRVFSYLFDHCACGTRLHRSTEWLQTCMGRWEGTAWVVDSIAVLTANKNKQDKDCSPQTS